MKKGGVDFIYLFLKGSEAGWFNPNIIFINQSILALMYFCESPFFTSLHLAWLSSDLSVHKDMLHMDVNFSRISFFSIDKWCWRIFLCFLIQLEQDIYWMKYPFCRECAVRGGWKRKLFGIRSSPWIRNLGSWGVDSCLIRCMAVYKQGGLDAGRVECRAVWVHGGLGAWRFGCRAGWMHGGLDACNNMGQGRGYLGRSFTQSDAACHACRVLYMHTNFTS